MQAHVEQDKFQLPNHLHAGLNVSCRAQPPEQALAAVARRIQGFPNSGRHMFRTNAIETWQPAMLQ